MTTEAKVCLCGITRKAIGPGVPRVSAEAIVQDFRRRCPVHGSKHYDAVAPRHKDWETPPDFYRRLDAEFAFTYDAAASHDNRLCSLYSTKEGTFGPDGLVDEDDGLTRSWSGERVYCNPPYDRSLPRWIAKAAEREAAIAVLLLPPSVDTAWFHDYLWAHPVELRFLRGRLKFWREGAVGPAPRAGNMLAIFRPLEANHA